MSDDIKNRYFGRRQFLLGVGGHILLLPVMTSMLPRALAQAAQAHRRIALFPTFLGMHTKYLQPNRTAINAMLQTHASGVRHMRLQDLPKPISLMVDGGYEDLLSQMNIFANLDMMQDLGHTYGIFCGSGAAVPNDRSNRMPTYGKTIDVMIEKTAAFKSSFKGQFPTLRISSDTQYANQATLSYDRGADGLPIPLPYQQGDQNLVNKLFATQLPQTGTPLNERKTRIADSIRTDLNALKNHRRISKDDKLMLERYIAGVDDLETNLNNQATLSCSKPTLGFQMVNDSRNRPQTIANASTEKFYDNIFQMAMLAFACDQSRMMVVMNSLAGADFSQRYQHHAEDEINNEGSDGQVWYLKQIAKFARKLRDFPDPSGNGSLLDNSFLLMANEHSGRRGHSMRDLPMVSFGKLGGAVTTGNYADYHANKVTIRPGVYNNFGTPMKMLLATLMQSMGVPKSEYVKEGDGHGYGQWGTHGELYYPKFKNTHSDPLPFFTAGT